MINLTQPVRSRYVVVKFGAKVGEGFFRMDVYGCHAGKSGYSVPKVVHSM